MAGFELPVLPGPVIWLVTDIKIGFCLINFLDVRTQAMYQLLDTGFIGLIFSCFNEDVHKVSVASFGIKNVITYTV